MTRDLLLPYRRRGGRLAGALTPITLRPEDSSDSQGLTFPVNVFAILVEANLKIQNSAWNVTRNIELSKVPADEAKQLFTSVSQSILWVVLFRGEEEEEE